MIEDVSRNTSDTSTNMITLHSSDDGSSCKLSILLLSPPNLIIRKFIYVKIERICFEWIFPPFCMPPKLNPSRACIACKASPMME